MPEHDEPRQNEEHDSIGAYRRTLNNGAALVSDCKSGCDYGEVGEERYQECAEVQ